VIENNSSLASATNENGNSPECFISSPGASAARFFFARFFAPLLFLEDDKSLRKPIAMNKSKKNSAIH